MCERFASCKRYKCDFNYAEIWLRPLIAFPMSFGHKIEMQNRKKYTHREYCHLQPYPEHIRILHFQSTLSRNIKCLSSVRALAAHEMDFYWKIVLIKNVRNSLENFKFKQCNTNKKLLKYFKKLKKIKFPREFFW